MNVSTLQYIPDILAYGAGLALAIIMLRRGGGRAEKLLLSGCVLMFVVQLARPLLQLLIRSVVGEYGIAAVTIGFITLPSAVLGLAGLVCLVLAFWFRFKRKRQETP